ncbi:hypothetical protein JMJ77_0002734 [Colletotrichum scovillei]|uniref:Uncharacterized protein n=1 Tax=Colletotrichum scovillei TaxID=1209932 RepID=A0A9P7R8K7_9PEZI|nr:hypothetical protein JMJ77_0002734 [Colletotrichum scovillei]KAG7071158.1 hypothetical protein JMJ76_0002395 [Colletotrichum scovillei]KAG7079388.1 hypothetical protein JMJ78_0003042 [Colletotrichum scovillei]
MSLASLHFEIRSTAIGNGTHGKMEKEIVVAFGGGLAIMHEPAAAAAPLQALKRERPAPFRRPTEKS